VPSPPGAFTVTFGPLPTGVTIMTGVQTVRATPRVNWGYIAHCLNSIRDISRGTASTGSVDPAAQVLHVCCPTMTPIAPCTQAGAGAGNCVVAGLIATCTGTASLETSWAIKVCRPYSMPTSLVTLLLAWFICFVFLPFFLALFLFHLPFPSRYFPTPHRPAHTELQVAIAADTTSGATRTLSYATGFPLVGACPPPLLSVLPHTREDRARERGSDGGQEHRGQGEQEGKGHREGSRVGQEDRLKKRGRARAREEEGEEEEEEVGDHALSILLFPFQSYTPSPSY
jgi:hypothetical protein